MAYLEKHSTTLRDDDARLAGVAKHLTPVLHNLIALGVNGKQAHWHVRGENFVSVHEFLDEIIAHAQDNADTIAERLVALGLAVDARINTVAEKSGNPAMLVGFQQAEVTVREMIAQLDATLDALYSAVDGLERIDPVSQDLVIAAAQLFDKDRWFLNSHYAK
ncbi:Dps family protein [Leucobacter denitrificans]|uniref:DNA starvation/stationary phase protection protein n=1 Tax=Leucobacter denitrificans TaxID=683042 RepID=A0A7G9S5K6_9MICO|nr:DNA starvation/stationary phase protection protein [Leucobacter denitrificans]QNN63131.1 DNA starvation/stationary phase protection protein [Leucobacter denitrificans]